MNLQVSIRIHEDLDIEHFSECCFGENQNALDKDHIARLNSERLSGAAVCGEIVDGHFNRLSVAKSGDVLDQQIGFE